MTDGRATGSRSEVGVDVSLVRVEEGDGALQSVVLKSFVSGTSGTRPDGEVVREVSRESSSTRVGVRKD